MLGLSARALLKVSTADYVICSWTFAARIVHPMDRVEFCGLNCAVERHRMCAITTSFGSLAN